MEQSQIRFRNVYNSSELTEQVISNENVLNEEEKKLSDKQQQTVNTSSSLSVENICWLIASIICAYYSDIINVILHDHRIYRSLMVTSFCLIGINVAIASYMIIWLTHVKKVSANQWNESNPVLIPIATACFISGSIL